MKISIESNNWDTRIVLEYYGVDIEDEKVSPKGVQLIVSCLWHVDGATPNLSFLEEEGVYHCWSCGSSGNLLTLVSHIEKVDNKQAYQILKEIHKGKIKNKYFKPLKMFFEKKDDSYNPERYFLCVKYLYEVCKSEVEKISLENCLRKIHYAEDSTKYLLLMKQISEGKIFQEHMTKILKRINEGIKKRDSFRKYIKSKNIINILNKESTLDF